jgi:DNA-binding response OmpR family regulator
MMPEMSGYDVCRQVRRDDKHIPIIMLTAKGEEIDKVVGLELGADDYVTKPFGLHELRARIKAVLRRSEQNHCEEDQATLPEQFDFGPSRINRRRLEGQCGEKTFHLTAREIKLLEIFYLHPGEVLSRDQLLNAAWGIDYQGTTRTLDQHIAQLRKKIECNPEQPEAIQTAHGIGYRYSGPG